MRDAVDGVLVIHKPAGPTSHDIVAVVRRALGMRRVGHTGTLDPNASGVLPLVLGHATRLAQYLTASDKEYEAIVRFGVETDTYDSAGRVVRESGKFPTRDDLVVALDGFRGAFDQLPPLYSAKKVDGDRAYDLARQAKPVTLAAAPVVAHALDLLSFDPPLARLRVVSSAGFYVRSLAHDLGTALGTGAILQELVRTRAGSFALHMAVPLADVIAGPLERLRARVIPLEALLPHLPAIALTADGMRRLSHGQDLRPEDWGGAALTERHGHTLVRLLSPHGALLGLAEPAKIAGFLHPAVVFPRRSAEAEHSP
jgi:tRNA pseudouridine55 synthase